MLLIFLTNIVCDDAHWSENWDALIVVPEMI